MLRTPLKNSKTVYVNKPFKSPFESPAQREQSCKKAKQNRDAAQSPLSTRNKEAKRILLLDDNEKGKKRRKILENEDPNLSEANDNQKLPGSNKDKKLKINKKDSKDPKEDESNEVVEKIVEEVTKNDLQILKRRIFELRQELDCLKSKERCTIKHNPDDLKVSIKKWREACQNALEMLCSELAERNGQNYKISDILKQLNIPEAIVQYSEKDDSFI